MEIPGYRYPGAKPFESADTNLFFGRERDVASLMAYAQINPITVLHGKSGIGKTSLAHICSAKLATEHQADVCYIRFGTYISSAVDQTPLQKVILSLLHKVPAASELSKIQSRLPNLDFSLWHALKKREFSREANQGYLVLVFDQFEELFTYPSESIDAFASELGRIIAAAAPKEYENLAITNPETLSAKSWNALLSPPKIHILLLIRSDRLHLLNDISQYLPTVFQQQFRLGPLSPEQAREALIRPAVASGEYISPVFHYAPEAEKEIIDFLSSGGTRSIEPFQLQILASTIERKIEHPDFVVRPEYLGSIHEIFENYYEFKIENLDDEEQLAARNLIENGLILEEEKMRLTLHEGQIARDYPVSRETLEQLVNSNLLRRVLSEKGGFLYELSHDTLVDPILQSKMTRIERERQQRKVAEYEALRTHEQSKLEKIRTERRQTRRLTLALLLSVLLNLLLLWLLVM